ncbi:putative procollagen-proline 4-dioxygenase [Lupinus albus]|uniref:procollagen-proline 4-dioxygenase n=1 Tax=Lupinus albus TaxID=3870 RepID=A0A6A4QRX4_LUPAL|nr:putative procollagen-proline 4-dioxygenase [Lupinus albus]
MCFKVLTMNFNPFTLLFYIIKDEVIANIEARIATWTFLPYENGEPMQILHYELGQKYESHFDYSLHKLNQQFGGNRVATVLMYLSNVEKANIVPKDESWSECARNGYAVKPKKGDALLFFSLLPNTTLDTRSLHRSCPVIEGEKWSATKWIYVKDFDNSVIRFYSEKCNDENEKCSIWAKRGECEKNPLYMVGNEIMRGLCMKSCNVC